MPYFPKEKYAASAAENAVSVCKESEQEKALETIHDVSMIKAGLASFM